MIQSEQSVIIQQKKMKQEYKFQTPTNQLDISQNDQSLQQNGQVIWNKSEPQTKKNLIPVEQPTQQFPFLYAQGMKTQPNNEKPKPSCWQILFPQFNFKTINFAVFLLLLLYFIFTYCYYLFGPYDKLGCSLYQLGAKFTPMIKHYGHFHRLIVSIPLFGSLLHAGISLLTILMFGFVLEQYIGKCKYIFLLFISGYMSNLLSGLIYPYYVTVGSVGFIYGILTMYSTFIYNKYEQLGVVRNLIISLYLLIVGANFLAMIDTKAMDIGGVVGGVIGGGFLSFGFYQKESITPLYKNCQIACFLILFAIMAGLTAALFVREVDNINMEDWCN